MKREEAITFLKEITSTCGFMTPDSVDLFRSRTDDQNAVGYQVHIKTVLDAETKRQVRNIAEKYSLALKEEEDEVVIYRPKEATKTVQ